jgi:hypothetical protein
LKRLRTTAIVLGLIAAILGLGMRSASAAPANVEKPGLPTFGMAVNGGSSTLYQKALTNGLPVQWARLYVANTVPASFAAFPGALAASQEGLKLWLSIWLNPTQLAAGVFDTQLATFAATLPAGTRLTLMHEPSTAAHGLTPAAYVAAFDHGSSVIQAAAPQVLTGPIDVQFNVIRYHFMDTLDRKYVQFVGLDGYDGIGGTPNASLQKVASAAIAYTQNQFPGVPVGFAEFNTSRTVGRAQWIDDALTWGASIGLEPMLLFTSASQWLLTDQEQQDLAKLITVPATATPTVAITTPTNNSTVSGTAVTVSGTAADTTGISQVQVSVDGGTPVTAVVGGTSWSATIDTTALTNDSHTITATATDPGNLTGTASISVTVNNASPPAGPTVSIGAPANNSTVSGAAVSVTGTAADTTGISQVQVSVDGSTPVTAVVGATGWSATIDTTGLTNSSHTITATATDPGNLTGTASVTVTVNNAPPPRTCPATAAGATELSSNLSLETNQTGWTGAYNPASQLTRVAPTGGAYSGTWALQIAPKAGNSGIAGVRNASPAWVPGPPGLATVAGHVYAGSAFVRASVAGEQVSMLVGEVSPAGTVLHTHTSTMTLTDTNWHQISSPYTAAAAGNSIRYSLYASNFANSGQSLLADCLSLQKS